MSIIATCGHELTKDERTGDVVATKDYDRVGKRAISYKVLCKSCLKSARKTVLKTEEDQNNWLFSKDCKQIK